MKKDDNKYLKSQIDLDNITVFGNLVTKNNIDLESFEIIKISEKGILTKALLKEKAYRSYISITRLMNNNCYNLPIILKSYCGNILAFVNEKDVSEELKTSNEIYFVYTNEKELSYASIGLPIKPNELYCKNELNGIKTNVKRFNTLIGSYRIEIDFTNTCFEKELDDVSF